MAREGEKSPVLNHRHINDERKYTSPAHLAAKLRPCLIRVQSAVKRAGREEKNQWLIRTRLVQQPIDSVHETIKEPQTGLVKVMRKNSDNQNAVL